MGRPLLAPGPRRVRTLFASIAFSPSAPHSGGAYFSVSSSKAAGGSHALKRGGDHVMFMGLSQPFEPGVTVPVVLEFEKAGEIRVEIPVDLDR